MHLIRILEYLDLGLKDLGMEMQTEKLMGLLKAKLMVIQREILKG